MGVAKSEHGQTTERDERGYGAAEEDVNQHTPPQEQPHRPEHEPSDTSGERDPSARQHEPKRGED
jgi:hypothetical protein